MASVANVCFAGTQAKKLGSDASARNAITVNPRNATLTAPIGPSIVAPIEGSAQLATWTSKFWEAESTLRVKFLAGTDWQRGKVKQYAPFWTKFGNISFEFVDNGECEILIDFNPELGSWSYIGTDCKYFAGQGTASMNLGWILQDRSEDTLRQVILHQFGHALGAVDQHDSPLATIQWNESNVYRDLGGPPINWDKAKADRNMFTLYTQDQVQAAPFDPKSIMLYQYPASWTLDGGGTSFNSDLSDEDKSYIASCYPGKTVDAGFFNTWELHSWSEPQLTNHTQKALQRTYANPPRIAVGLNFLDVDYSKGLRIAATAQNINTTHFTASLDAWADTILYAAGMTYLELGSDFGYIQTGTFNTQEVRPWNQPQPDTSKRIGFSTPFTGAPPKVVCWLNSLDVASGKNCRVLVTAKDVNQNGFTASVSSWADTTLYSAGITWIAYPADQKKVASGAFSTGDIRPWNQPSPSVSGNASFGSAFTAVPKLAIGLSSLDFDGSRNLRIKTSTSGITSSSFTWNLQSWHDSVMYSAGAQWFAWA